MRPVALCLAAALTGACSTSEPAAPDCAAGTCDEAIDAGAGGAELCAATAGAFPKEWIQGGPDCGQEPAIQVHRYDDDTFILRQSLCTSAEGPFLYLLFGEDRALLEDTGDNASVPIPLVDTVKEIIRDRLAATGRDSIELVVVNSHAHGDHVAGNKKLAQAGAKVVGFTSDEISAFFGIEDWPNGSAAFDLGGRVVDVLPIPGHEDNHIALYDRSRGLLLTGDTLYPGRLFIDDFGTYVSSIRKLAEFTANRPTCHVLGTHIEMSTKAGEQFPPGSTHHPKEHALRLGREHIVELLGALEKMTTPRRETHDDFVIFPL
jgi:glyoxylase-like metal-dependent hydrolase (beta-lactamase superfamily II)